MKNILKYNIETRNLEELEMPQENKLEFFQEHVRGLIEFVSLTDSIDMIVDEEGAIRGDRATSLTIVKDNKTGFEIQLFGHVLFTSLDWETGETVGLNEVQREYIEKNVTIRLQPLKIDLVKLRYTI
ncbi:hypothetical protein BHX94_12210 (plasmid) [Macrococcoides bohemicum]|uniref:DUF3846 domain-containing protein n=1 Tax=Macrococcoides bohemicum TaxID=1903056 RepID=A0A328A009_9STAP|nr:DUF3846 domain-containing protein [Macrococcus bohemicus]RAK47839.1 hypothetical protein BHX94_12210 [Macrococcus bohemicus]